MANYNSIFIILFFTDNMIHLEEFLRNYAFLVKSSAYKIDFKSKEYYMKDFNQMVEKKQSANIWGPRVIVPGAGSIR